MQEKLSSENGQDKWKATGELYDNSPTLWSKEPGRPGGYHDEALSGGRVMRHNSDGTFNVREPDSTPTSPNTPAATHEVITGFGTDGRMIISEFNDDGEERGFRVEIPEAQARKHDLGSAAVRHLGPPDGTLRR